MERESIRNDQRLTSSEDYRHRCGRPNRSGKNRLDAYSISIRRDHAVRVVPNAVAIKCWAIELGPASTVDRPTPGPHQRERVGLQPDSLKRNDQSRRWYRSLGNTMQQKVRRWSSVVSPVGVERLLPLARLRRDRSRPRLVRRDRLKLLTDWPSLTVRHRATELSRELTNASEAAGVVDPMRCGDVDHTTTLQPAVSNEGAWNRVTPMSRRSGGVVA